MMAYTIDVRRRPSSRAQPAIAAGAATSTAPKDVTRSFQRSTRLAGVGHSPEPDVHGRAQAGQAEPPLASQPEPGQEHDDDRRH